MKPNLAEAQRNELASLLVAATDELDRVIVQRGELLAALRLMLNKFQHDVNEGEAGWDAVASSLAAIAKCEVTA